jgi:hypothetical protein
MIELRDKADGRVVGSITDEQLQFMMDQLEEESAADTDYCINQTTLEMFVERGIDLQLLAILRNALGDREDMEIEWVRR